jgi:hypothetical protein
MWSLAQVFPAPGALPAAVSAVTELNLLRELGLTARLLLFCNVHAQLGGQRFNACDLWLACRFDPRDRMLGTLPEWASGNAQIIRKT